MTRRRSKICCTLGPATSSPDAIRALVDAGMDPARLNFSRGTHADHAILYERVREASDATGRSVAVLADLQGPKIRLGRSFVRHAGDAAAVRQVMEAAGRSVPVIAKIEKPEAVADLDAIADAFDGLMVARGDLGIEVSTERVPLVQKDIAQLGRERGKPVIVATHLLESMTHRSRPTRAEASDVANAVLDGADALLFSGETSVGEHATEVVATAARIVAMVEEHALDRMPAVGCQPLPEDAVAAAACQVGATVGARAVAVFTQTGRTAQRVASHRSAIPVMAFTSEPGVRSHLSLAWGVETFVAPVAPDARAAIAQVERTMLSEGHGVAGERVVVVAGRPGQAGSTNTVLVHELASAPLVAPAW